MFIPEINFSICLGFINLYLKSIKQQKQWFNIISKNSETYDKVTFVIPLIDFIII